MAGRSKLVNKAYWLAEKKLVETKAWLEYLKGNVEKNI
jgi:hypothetical protein